MKFRIARSTFMEAVSQVSKAVSQKTTIPILTGIKITADESGLTLTGSNSDLTIQVFIKKRKDDKEQVLVDKIGNVVLPGKIFGDIIRKLPGEEVEVEVGERFLTSIRSQQSQFQLKGLDADEYPHLPELHDDQMFSFPADLLKTMIRQTGFAAATSEARGILTGVLWQLSEGNLTFVATDSHRLSKRNAQVESPAELTLSNVVVPGKSMTELAKILADQEGWVDVIVSENQILLKAGTILFFSRLLEGNYPDTNRVIPSGGKTEVTAATKELLHSVERAALISRDGRDNVIKWTIKENGSIQVQSDDKEIGSVSEEVPATVTGEEMTIAFNAYYMMESLRTIESDSIRILCTGMMTPFLIQPADRDDALHLIVPIRTR
ncbi:DNA polymerase III subunit beta [Mechercharimyces sp. CAU 1602]|uniref:DNA polymerase III subunit beta n=1 Tax=Mechercharimyces sp. CAU 1602 TaxID=2973933 RepID=UPI002162E584|nr:DNA polymerase III subunit beta [Mechercharimyces sp. CAU 1602]MCS1352700.1 DNA polymerase III subunit beta [Mechercharimyces sp. CAU 1602]